jgi:hypothetical protein
MTFARGCSLLLVSLVIVAPPRARACVCGGVLVNGRTYHFVATRYLDDGAARSEQLDVKAGDDTRRVTLVTSREPQEKWPERQRGRRSRATGSAS